MWILLLFLSTAQGQTQLELIKTFERKTKDLAQSIFSGPKIRSAGPTEEILYVTLSTLWYPKNDMEKRRQISTLWNKYYECTVAQAAAMGKYKMFVPQAVTALLFGTVHLKCSICLSPNHSNRGIDWWKKITVGSEPEQMIEDDTVIIQDDGTLSMYMISAEDAGVYYCMVGGTQSALIFLHVFGDHEPVVSVRPEIGRLPPLPQKDTSILSYYVLTTLWGPWNHCTKCGTVGRRTRFGACFIKGPKMEFDATEVDGAISVFLQGIPCRSPFLLNTLSVLENVQKRPNEVMVGFCKEPCTDILFEIKDEDGKLLQTVNNSQGVYSTLQSPPKLPPMVTRTVKFPKIGEPFTIQCPSTRVVDTPTEWVINRQKRVITYFTNNTSHGRVYVDPRDRIHFKEIEESDAHMYMCYQNHEIAGVVALVPVHRRNPNVLQVDGALLGILVMLCLIFYVMLNFYRNHSLIDRTESLHRTA